MDERAEFPDYPRGALGGPTRTSRDGLREGISNRIQAHHGDPRASIKGATKQPTPRPSTLLAMVEAIGGNRKVLGVPKHLEEKMSGEEVRRGKVRTKGSHYARMPFNGRKTVGQRNSARFIHPGVKRAKRKRLRTSD